MRCSRGKRVKRIAIKDRGLKRGVDVGIRQELGDDRC